MQGYTLQAYLYTSVAKLQFASTKILWRKFNEYCFLFTNSYYYPHMHNAIYNRVTDNLTVKQNLLQP